MPTKISPFLTLHDDGTVEIFGNREGLPEITGVVPAPDVNTKSEQDRRKQHNDALEQIILMGYYIKSTKLIRNEAFDDPGQRTTLQIVYRPCKNEEETNELFKKFQKIMDRKTQEYENSEQQKEFVENPDFLEIL
jgi:hypothetical protein